MTGFRAIYHWVERHLILVSFAILYLLTVAAFLVLRQEADHRIEQNKDRIADIRRACLRAQGDSDAKWYYAINLLESQAGGNHLLLEQLRTFIEERPRIVC